jgi:hypothetical protein
LPIDRICVLHQGGADREHWVEFLAAVKEYREGGDFPNSVPGDIGMTGSIVALQKTNNDHFHFLLSINDDRRKFGFVSVVPYSLFRLVMPIWTTAGATAIVERHDTMEQHVDISREECTTTASKEN